MSDFDKWWEASKYIGVSQPTNPREVARAAWDAALLVSLERLMKGFEDGKT